MTLVREERAGETEYDKHKKPKVNVKEVEKEFEVLTTLSFRT